MSAVRIGGVFVAFPTPPPKKILLLSFFFLKIIISKVLKFDYIWHFKLKTNFVLS